MKKPSPEQETWQVEAEPCGHIITVYLGSPQRHDCEITRAIERIEARLDRLERHAGLSDPIVNELDWPTWGR